MELVTIIAVALIVIGALWFLLRKKPEKSLPAPPAADAPSPRPAPETKPAATAPAAQPKPPAAPATPAPVAPVTPAAAKTETEATPAPSATLPEPPAPAPRAPEIMEAPASIMPAARPQEELLPKAASEGDRAQARAAYEKGLSATRGGFVAKLARLFRGNPAIDQALLDQAEELLLSADVGVATAGKLLEALKTGAGSGQLRDEESVLRALAQLSTQILRDVPTRSAASGTPRVILVIGVNGVGKTTTIGKLASRLQREGKRVLLAAGDTFRAAAVLQLEVWGRRVECPVVKGKEGADPGAVIFDAIKRAQAEGVDTVIADTAGRLHTKVPLMDELKKVARTVEKALGRPADEVLLVLDATTGQNAVQQMQMFREAMEISGIVLTKLDGTAKGGVVLGIVNDHKVPVRFVGLGEKVEDLREFDADEFAAALFDPTALGESA